VVLSEFNSNVYHIQGEFNHIADLMTRWSVSRIRKLEMNPHSTPDLAAEEPESLIQFVNKAQLDMTQSERDRLDMKQRKGISWLGARVYVLRSAVDVKIRLLIVAHCG
jgi:hypothetical protein